MYELYNAYLQRFDKFLMKCFRIDYFLIDHHSLQSIFCFLLNSFVGITTSGNKFLSQIRLLEELGSTVVFWFKHFRFKQDFTLPNMKA